MNKRYWNVKPLLPCKVTLDESQPSLATPRNKPQKTDADETEQKVADEL
jgi:hypothetical protein